jgi:Ca-activated chloride channel family protein
MRVSFAPLAIVFLLCGAAASHAQQPQQPAPPAQETPPVQTQPIRTNGNLVNVLFNVVNQRNRIVADLNQSDFKVFDDNMPQEIRFFSRQNDLPLRVGLLLDTSNSIRERIQFEQDAATDFLYGVIRRDKDQAFLMDVDDSPEIVQDFTGNLDRLRDAIQHQRAGGGTALYDAVYEAAQHLAMHVAQPVGAPLEARAVLVVISDGDDNVSRHSRGEALEMARRAGVVIYTISTSIDWIITDKETNTSNTSERKYFKNDGDKLLEQFANDSGGQAFFPYHADDLGISFANIGEQLRSQYSLGYVPDGRSADGKFHTIRIDVTTKGLKVQARKGYFANLPASETDSPAK